MFGCNGKYNFPEIVFLLTRIYAFNPKMNLRSHFHFNSFLEREREKREPRSEREWEKRELRSESTDRRSHRLSDDRTTPTSSIDGIARCDRPDSEIARCDRWDHIARRRGFWFDEIASLVDEIACRPDDCIARRSDDRIAPIWALSSLMIGDSFSFAGFWFLLPDLMHFAGFWLLVVDDFFLGCGLWFSVFVFSFFFSKHQKIFSGKFFEMQPNTMETFSFSGN